MTFDSSSTRDAMAEKVEQDIDYVTNGADEESMLDKENN